MVCKTCGGKPFRKNGSICKPCSGRDYYARNKERILQKCKEYVTKNADKVRETHRKRRETVEDRYKYAKSRSKRDGREFDISFEEFQYLMSNPCKYCNGPLNPTAMGLDRKDSSLGYLLYNVVPCCYNCNRVKSDVLTHDEMRVAMDAVLKFREGKL